MFMYYTYVVIYYIKYIILPLLLIYLININYI